MDNLQLTGKYDPILSEILREEGDSIPAFFNAVFGFLSRHCPEKIYNSSQISGEHLINQSFCKWREKYLQDKRSALNAISEDLDVPPVAEEIVIPQEDDDNAQGAKEGAAVGECRLISHSEIKPRKDGKEEPCFTTSNGAVRDTHAWTQTVEDIEVRISVPDCVKKGKQVKVNMQASSLDVSYQESLAWKTCLVGKLAHTIKPEESMWSLAPGEHILINLEKRDERWWDRLMCDEEPIDMERIDAERDFSTLPQEEQEKIRELVWNKQQQEQGKPTSDRLKMESMLRDAWNAEGSPFKGQAFDPSKVNFTSGAKF